MSWDAVWALLSAGADAIDAFLASPWDGTKVLQSLAACVTILAGAFGLYQALRFAEKRLSQRLQEYLERDEQRLREARTALLGAVTKGVPKKPNIKPVFLSDALTKALKQLKWGRIGQAETSLIAALKLAEEKVEAAGKLVAHHEMQKAAAHLLLGAIADSKKDHLAALQHFQAALKINSEDIEALEYAGLQSLYIPDATTALSYFTRMLEIGTKRDDPLMSTRAKVLQARAYAAFAQPNYAEANAILISVVRDFPHQMGTIDRAKIHEFHGDVRREANFNGVASASYVSALALYSQVAHQANSDAEATAGFDRVTKWIATLNQSPQGHLPSVATQQMSATQSIPVVLPPPSRPSKSDA